MAKNINDLCGIKESDTGLAAPSQWDLVSDKQMIQEEQPLQKMGGCCCSSRKPQFQAQFHGAPLYYYYPHSEEHESLTSRDGVATILSSSSSSSSSSGLLIDLNMNMSIPDIYRSPPAPIPYDVVLGQPQSTVSESCGSFGKKPNCMDLEDENCKNHLGGRPRNVEFGLIKSDSFSVSETNNKDSCPTCLEEYDAENPKIMTKCKHHFHLTCILEWMERSDTCPICDQEMKYEVF